MHAFRTHQTTVTLCAYGPRENDHGEWSPCAGAPAGTGAGRAIPRRRLVEIAMRVALHVGEMPDHFHVARIVLGYRCNSQQLPQ